MKKSFLEVIAVVMVVSFILFSGIANADTVSFAGYTMEANGSAGVVGGVLRLTPDSGNQAGSAFINTPFALNPDTSFSSFFKFRIYGTQGTNGSDGLTFILQNSPAGIDALGGDGESL